MRTLKKLVVLFVALVVFIGVIEIRCLSASAATKEADFYVTKGATGTFYGKSRVINFIGVPGVKKGTSNNYARFNVYFKNELIATQDFEYSNSSEPISWGYLITNYGEYKITFSHLSYNSSAGAFYEDYTKEAVIKVVKPSKAKKATPVFTASNHFNASTYSNTVQIAGLDSNATTSIYRSESKKGKYTLVAEVNAATYEDYIQDNSKTYYYKIKVTVKSGKKKYTTKNSKPLELIFEKP